MALVSLLQPFSKLISLIHYTLLATDDSHKDSGCPAEEPGFRLMMATKQIVASLYRRSLKLSLDWAVHRSIWRGQALYIRSLFEANRDVREPRQQRVLFQEAEALLEKWKHPDPYHAPTAPGGSKYERNIPAPILDPPPYMTL